MTAADHPVYELTRNPVDESWGFICREHGVHRSGLTQPHALNVERKHLREDHADQDTPDAFDLTAAARIVVGLVRAVELEVQAPSMGATAGKKLNARKGATLNLWEALTGLQGEAAIAYARKLSEADTPAIAHLAPF